MQTMVRCKEGTYGYEPTNYTFCCNFAQRRQWKFAQIRGYFYTGAMLAPMQGAYEKEAKVIVNLKILTIARCKKGTYEDGPANYTLSCNYVQPRDGNLRKFGATSTPVQCLHECNAHMKRKLRCW